MADPLSRQTIGESDLSVGIETIKFICRLKQYIMDDQSKMVMMGLLYIVLFFVAVLITRAIFSIGTIVKHLKAQTILLIKMAENQGIPKEEIDKARIELMRQ